MPDVVVPVVVQSPWKESLTSALRSAYIAGAGLGAGMLVQAAAQGYGIGTIFPHPLWQWFTMGYWYGYVVAFVIGPFWRGTRAFSMAQTAQVVGTPVPEKGT